MLPTLVHAQPTNRVPTPTRVMYDEPFRPQYHFTPAVNWMNDPNGLVYFDGEYHLFYQHNPFGDGWGHMSWGHAVSPDLVHWRHLPVAIPELGAEMVFSGSVVVDRKNTSGFGVQGKPPLVAIYTAHNETPRREAQALAYSTDRGRTWTRYRGNPVIDIGEADFRDPKVFWYAPLERWIMVAALPLQHKVRFFASPDLKWWTALSDFGPAGSTGGIWECPDLFELPVDGDARNTRWVLIVSLNPGGPAGGSATQYFVGRFDGTRFIADGNTVPSRDPGAGALWADFGKDFYAGVSFSDIARSDGRRIWLGWMSNWQYAGEIPTSPWRGTQSIPRTLALRTTPEGVRLVQTPIAELERLRGVREQVAARPIPPGDTPLAPHGVSGRSLELDVELAGGTATDFGMKVLVGEGQETTIGVDTRAGTLYVDRTRSGHVSFHKDFPSRHVAPLAAPYDRVRFRVFVDRSSVEVFAADGRVVFTDQLFPAAGSTGVALFAREGTATLRSLSAWRLTSAWPAAGVRR